MGYDEMREVAAELIYNRELNKLNEAIKVNDQSSKYTTDARDNAKVALKEAEKQESLLGKAKKLSEQNVEGAEKVVSKRTITARESRENSDWATQEVTDTEKLIVNSRETIGKQLDNIITRLEGGLLPSGDVNDKLPILLEIAVKYNEPKIVERILELGKEYQAELLGSEKSPNMLHKAAYANSKEAYDAIKNSASSDLVEKMEKSTDRHGRTPEAALDKAKSDAVVRNTSEIGRG